jgi:hypothetical protein
LPAAADPRSGARDFSPPSGTAGQTARVPATNALQLLVGIDGFLRSNIRPQ